MPQSAMLADGGEKIRCKEWADAGKERLFGSTFNDVAKERTAGGARPRGDVGLGPRSGSVFL